MFHILEDAYAVLVNGGVYRQTKVYERKGRLFANYGAGFIPLSARGGTGVPKVRLDEIKCNFTPKKNELGFLVNPETYDGKMNEIKETSA